WLLGCTESTGSVAQPPAHGPTSSPPSRIALSRVKFFMAVVPFVKRTKVRARRRASVRVVVPRRHSRRGGERPPRRSGNDSAPVLRATDPEAGRAQQHDREARATGSAATSRPRRPRLLGATHVIPATNSRSGDRQYVIQW